MLDAVILSDLHLGSDNSQAQRIAALLKRLSDGDLTTERLILNGDVFDSIDFRRLNKHHWRVLSLIRKLSDQMEIIWLCGNHDGSAEIISHLLGVQVQDEYILETGGRRVLIFHGHIYDEFLDSHPFLTWLADVVYFFLQRIDRTHSLAKVAKRGSKTFLRSARTIEQQALEHAERRGCQAVCCGHTHHAAANTAGPIHYFNSGCWTELPCSYLTVARGDIRLHLFQPAAEPVTAAEALATVG